MGRRKTRFDLLRKGFLDDVKPALIEPVETWERPFVYAYEYLWPLSTHLPCVSCGELMVLFFVIPEDRKINIMSRGMGYPSCSKPKCTRKLKTDLLAWHYRMTLEKLGPTIWDRLRPRYPKRIITPPFQWDWRMMKEWHEQRCPMEYQLGC